MKAWLYTFGFSLLAISGLIFAALEVSAQSNVVSTLAGASVRLNLAGEGVCSATHIGGDRYLTAAHCTESGGIEAATDKGATASAEVLWSAKLYDLALLRVKGLKLRSATVDCQLVKVGTSVTAAGNPLGLSFIRTPGVIVSGLQPEQEIGGEKIWREHIIADITIAPGSSGGGLFDGTGRLVGVVVGMAYPFIRYAMVVPSSTVCQLLGR